MRILFGLVAWMASIVAMATPVAAEPLPGPCRVIAAELLKGMVDDCDVAAVHALMKATRGTGTQIDIKDLHQATYRDPVGAISNLAFRGFVGPKREDVPPVPLIIPVDWANANHDRNWRFNLNSWKMIEPMFAWHAKAGERLPLRMAMDLIADWTAFNVVQDKPNKLKWYDIATGQRAMKLAFLLDTIYRGRFKVSDQEKALLLGISHIHIEKLLDPDFINPGNHGTFQIHGLAALCRTLPMFELCLDADGYIADQMEKLVIGQFGDEAIHMEHSAEYHFFMYKVFERLFATGWYDDLAVTKTLLTRAEKNKRWLIFPTGEVVRHGDTDQRAEPLPDTAKMRLAHDCQDPTGRIADCYLLKTFPVAGYASVRSAWDADIDRASMLFMMGAYHSHAHKQRDHMSIELFEQGMPILVDSGKFAYDPSNPRRDYVLSTRAHNTVEIDETDYTRSKRNAVGSILRSSEALDWGYRIDAGMRHVTTDTRHDRTLAYRPGRWLLVVDRLSSDKVRRYEQWFHLHETLTAELADAGYVVRLPGGGRMRAIVASTGGDCKLRRVHGQEEPRLQGWISRAYRSFMPNDAVGYACRGDTVTLATLFVFEQDETATISLTRDAGDADVWRVTDARDSIVAAIAPPPLPEATPSARPGKAKAEPRKKSKKTPKQSALGRAPAGLADSGRMTPETNGSLSGRNVVGFALATGQGGYRANLRDLAVMTSNKATIELDEVDVAFTSATGPAAFALVCGDTPNAPCAGATPAGEPIGLADIAAFKGRYYQAGGFGGGSLKIHATGSDLTLAGSIDFTTGAAADIKTNRVPVHIEAIAVSARQLASLRTSRRAQCDMLDPRPILDELTDGRYATTTFAKIARDGADPDKVTVLVRHDVDHSIDAMTDLAALQAQRGLAATYFINLAAGFAGTMSGNGKYLANDRLIPHLLRLQADGHEIGYHTDALFMDLFHNVKIDVWLGAELDRLRQAGLTIVTEASNGSPYRQKVNTHNRFTYSDFRAGGQFESLVGTAQRRQLGFDGRIEIDVDGDRISRTLPAIGLADVGLKHAAYYPQTYGIDRRSYTYLTDSRLSASQIIAGLRAVKPGRVVQLLMHPWRWSLCEPGTLGSEGTAARG